jgi:hypothetical protein
MTNSVLHMERIGTVKLVLHVKMNIVNCTEANVLSFKTFCGIMKNYPCARLEVFTGM